MKKNLKKQESDDISGTVIKRDFLSTSSSEPGWSLGLKKNFSYNELPERGLFSYGDYLARRTPLNIVKAQLSQSSQDSQALQQVAPLQPPQNFSRPRFTASNSQVSTHLSQTPIKQSSISKAADLLGIGIQQKITELISKPTSQPLAPKRSLTITNSFISNKFPVQKLQINQEIPSRNRGFTATNQQITRSETSLLNHSKNPTISRQLQNNARQLSRKMTNLTNSLTPVLRIQDIQKEDSLTTDSEFSQIKAPIQRTRSSTILDPRISFNTNFKAKFQIAF